MKRKIALKYFLRSSKKNNKKIKEDEDPIPAIELTPKQFLAVRLYAQGTHTKREIADICKISTSLLDKWMALPEFMIAVKEQLNRYDKIDKDVRTKWYKDILNPLYAEFLRKISKGKLKKLSLASLKSLIIAFGKELRVDSGDATSRVGDEIDEISQRYYQSKERDIKEKETKPKREHKKTKVKKYYKSLGLGKIKKSKIKDVSKYLK